VSAARRGPSVLVIFAAVAATACLDNRTLIVPYGDYTSLSLEAGSVSPPAFSQPSALALIPGPDRAGVLYFADGRRIVQMATDSGAVDVLAGAEDGAPSRNGMGTDARFDSITDITTDGLRFLFVTDGCAIRKVDVTTREVTTLRSSVNDLCGPGGVAGGGTAPGPSHVSYCSSDLSLYVSDGAVLRQVNVDTGAVKEVDGADGLPWAPAGGAVGPVTCAGDTLFVADGRFLANGTVSTWQWRDPITGPFSSGLPITSLVSTSTYLFLLEGTTIWRVDPNTSTSLTCQLMPDGNGGEGLPSPYRCPASLARGVPGPSTEVFLTDSCTHLLRAINCENHAETTIVPASALTAIDGPGSDARFGGLSGVTTDDAGDVFVVDGRSIRKVASATHTVSTLASDALAGQPDITWPIGIVSDGKRYLYVVDPLEYTIRRIEVSTGKVSRLLGTQHEGVSTARISGLAIDRAGQKLYFTNVADGTIRSVDIGVDLNGQVSLVAGQRYLFGSDDGVALRSTWIFPSGLAFDGKRLLVADAGASTIRSIDLQANVVSTIAGIAGVPGTADGSGLQARFLEPISLALDAKGNLAVVDRLAGTVRRLEMANGAVTRVTTILGVAAAGGSPLPAPATKLGALPGQLYLPQAIAFSPANELFLTVPNALLVAR
jgi:hypothetical protein